ncbi:MAG: hypothetical protein OXC27_15645 [Caldilineaceae bacterium]|nr:hypothetical protein [Caldilineaceae bacterium]
MTDPALDQPQLEDYDDINDEARFPHNNGELYFVADKDSDLYDLRWHWHQRAYARSIRIRFDAPMYTSSGISSEQLDDVLPLAVQLYPGYQETIYGVEGVIVSKRIFAPLDSYYDRSLLWMMEAQAEGDRLIQIRVEIDWGEPLEQRMVDGLLVAQSDPGEASGAHNQRNAESTRVFGAAEGRPDRVHFPTDSQAVLLYHVLVAGQVDLPLILSLSDVGEQVAWNGFLVQRDISRAFKRSLNSWHDITHRGRLWSPDAQANRAVQDTKIEAVQNLARFRSGYAPADRATDSVPALVDLFDTFAPERSRAMLDTLRRVADRTGGALPRQLPTLPRGPVDAHDADIPFASASYLESLHAHLQRLPDPEWLSTHQTTISTIANELATLSRDSEVPTGSRGGSQGAAVRALIAASALARMTEQTEDAVRWAHAAARGGSDDDASPAPRPPAAENTIWKLLGITVENGVLTIRKNWPPHWDWWALLRLPFAGQDKNDEISLLWDGQTLHSTRQVTFDGPLALQSQVQPFGSDEHSFDLRFRLGTELYIPAFEKEAR